MLSKSHLETYSERKVSANLTSTPGDYNAGRPTDLSTILLV